MLLRVHNQIYSYNIYTDYLCKVYRINVQSSLSCNKNHKVSIIDTGMSFTKNLMTKVDRKYSELCNTYDQLW